MNDATPESVTITRCWTALNASPLMLEYHDREWGVPLHGDRALFAKLVLDGFQAGLSWAVICPSMQTPWTRCTATAGLPGRRAPAAGRRGFGFAPCRAQH